MSRDVIDTCAHVSAAGIDPLVFLRADPFEAKLMVQVANRRHRLEAERDDALAARIANAVWNGL